MFAMSQVDGSGSRGRESFVFKERLSASFLFSFLSSLFRLFEKHCKGGCKYIELISDSCFPSHAL